MGKFLGVVQAGQFRPLKPKPAGSVRFTRISQQAAQSPESGELNLSEYEGRAILIQGDGDMGWIYSADVIDSAEPILTMVVQHLFDQGDCST